MKHPLTKLALALTATTAICTAAQAASVTSEIKLTADDRVGDDSFGFSVALSDGTAIIGAYRDDDDSGSAYLFDINTGNQVAKLIASDRAEKDFFGISVAISGHTAIVGASGVAYLFDTKTGNQIKKLTAKDSAAVDWFGTSVAMSGRTAIVGAPNADSPAKNSGAAYLFDTVTGEQIAKLTASDSDGFDNFGSSVAISGNTAIVGAAGDDENAIASGAAYLFDVTTGEQLTKLMAAGRNHLGESVDIDDDIAIVGGRGVAHTFDISTGAHITTLIADDAPRDYPFGRAVAISNGVAVVGDNGGRHAFNTGVYTFDAVTGEQIEKIRASDAGNEIYVHGAAKKFGQAVAIDGSHILVGAPDSYFFSGSVYLYTIETAAVPLPAGVWLLGSALGALALRRRGRG